MKPVLYFKGVKKGEIESGSGKYETFDEVAENISIIGYNQGVFTFENGDSSNLNKGAIFFRHGSIKVNFKLTNKKKFVEIPKKKIISFCILIKKISAQFNSQNIELGGESNNPIPRAHQARVSKKFNSQPCFGRYGKYTLISCLTQKNLDPYYHDFSHKICKISINIYDCKFLKNSSSKIRKNFSIPFRATKHQHSTSVENDFFTTKKYYGIKYYNSDYTKRDTEGMNAFIVDNRNHKVLRNGKINVKLGIFGVSITNFIQVENKFYVTMAWNSFLLTDNLALEQEESQIEKLTFFENFPIGNQNNHSILAQIKHFEDDIDFERLRKMNEKTRKFFSFSYEGKIYFVNILDYKIELYDCRIKLMRTIFETDEVIVKSDNWVFLDGGRVFLLFKLFFGKEKYKCVFFNFFDIF